MKKFVCVAMSGVLAASFAVSASAADQIKVGGIGPTTGPAAIYGTAAMYGEQIAVDEVNKAGGAIQFDWKFEDDTHDAETSVNAYNSLKDWGMQILAGTVTTNPCLAVGAEAVNDNMFMMTPSASSQDVIDTGDNVFQICFTDPNQGTASADYISSKKLGTKIGVIYNSSDAYSSGINTNFQAEASKVGLQVVANEAFTDDNSTDLTTQVQACKDAGADLVFLPIYYTPASQILKAANDMGYKPKFFGCDGLDGILGVEGFDTSLAEGVMLLTPFVATSADKATQDFVAKYKEVSKGDTPNQFAADAYDVIKVLAKAGEKAGITADMSASDICDALKATITDPSFTYDGLTGTGMTWDASGAVSKEPKGMIIENGEYQPIDGESVSASTEAETESE
ncbi:MAG: ABC transporter substrate-binding protein [Lachnospiraceae bacterium]|jgi:branched-chain amino acid transport system substrate-binding protein|uniref:ABC transporter substrate-binding protein n=1 Tax=Porcincola intestinalis TaxID=2606632 RepID=A0A6L5X562_9FIRM|nr:ABC transporter substrate-binding protein [Porcincola intestinalis]MCI6238022.1 ABC transporter substrate-binding protein [Lachnospiraceae bacterium]MCI6767353.1 ABC transporter substrate-binding protein [Lachnospiraceae bacterium]MDY5331501.1 ABC transporter substrate-binding protein [Porcincola intestinalis]MSS15519.1 ABC transporter substrate-binding protein [Porcincola intestinalis]